VPLSKTGAELLFEMLSQRYERGSTLVTSNLPFAEWTEVLGSERLTGALLDRLFDAIVHDYRVQRIPP
jgi:DNA replication protein DnaC